MKAVKKRLERNAHDQAYRELSGPYEINSLLKGLACENQDVTRCLVIEKGEVATLANIIKKNSLEDVVGLVARGGDAEGSYILQFKPKFHSLLQINWAGRVIGHLSEGAIAIAPNTDLRRSDRKGVDLECGLVITNMDLASASQRTAIHARIELRASAEASHTPFVIHDPGFEVTTMEKVKKKPNYYSPETLKASKDRLQRRHRHGPAPALPPVPKGLRRLTVFAPSPHGPAPALPPYSHMLTKGKKPVTTTEAATESTPKAATESTPTTEAATESTPKAATEFATTTEAATESTSKAATESATTTEAATESTPKAATESATNAAGILDIMDDAYCALGHY